jgi:hypothetical protein
MRSQQPQDRRNHLVGPALSERELANGEPKCVTSGCDVTRRSPKSREAHGDGTVIVPSATVVIQFLGTNARGNALDRGKGRKKVLYLIRSRLSWMRHKDRERVRKLATLD